MTEPIEIADICGVLERLAHAEVLSLTATKACLRGAYLLATFRETVFVGRSDQEIVSNLKYVLAKNGEG